MARPKTGGRKSGVLFIVGAVVAAGITVFGILNVVQTANEEIEAAKQPPDTVPVVVAVKTLEMGVMIDKESLALRHLLPEMVPQDSVFNEIEAVEGRTPRTQILPNEIIRRGRLASADAGVGLNALIRKGKRAMTVEVDQESGVGGFIQPGNYVDIIVTIRPDDQAGRAAWATETILEGIPVLTVGNPKPEPEASGDDKSKKRTRLVTRRQKPSVTLELDPQEAEKLALAVSKGDIHLVLRGDLDITREAEPAPSDPLSASELIGYERPVGVRTYTAEVIQGSSTKTTRFDRAGNKVK
jgi:pilus assembly protein CpaB